MELKLEEPKTCKSCGKVIDEITSSKNEGMCRDCFNEKVSKIVHPF